MRACSQSGRCEWSGDSSSPVYIRETVSTKTRCVLTCPPGEQRPAFLWTERPTETRYGPGTCRTPPTASRDSAQLVPLRRTGTRRGVGGGSVMTRTTRLPGQTDVHTPTEQRERTKQVGSIQFPNFVQNFRCFCACVLYIHHSRNIPLQGRR